MNWGLCRQLFQRRLDHYVGVFDLVESFEFADEAVPLSAATGVEIGLGFTLNRNEVFHADDRIVSGWQRPADRFDLDGPILLRSVRFDSGETERRLLAGVDDDREWANFVRPCG